KRAFLRRGLMGLYRLRLDMDLLRRLRLGHLSLRALGESRRLWLGVVCGKRPRLGAGLGLVANGGRLHWLGAFASTRSRHCLRRTAYRGEGGHRVGYRPAILQFL